MPDMSLTLDIPDDLAAELAEAGVDAAARSRELLLIDLHISGRLTRGRLGQILGLSRFEVDDWLKQRNAPPTYTAEDLDADLRTLDDLYPDRTARHREVRTRAAALGVAPASPATSSAPRREKVSAAGATS